MVTTAVAADIRPMHPTDAGRLVAFHRTLSAETTRLRYFTIHRELSPDELDRFTHVDHVDREAIVATVEGRIVGVGRYDRIGTEPAAEIAFVVTDDLQGHGVAGRLFDALAERARRAGIVRFEAITLPDNHRMLRVFTKTGLPMTSRYVDGTVRVVLTLDAVRMDG